MCRKNKSYNFAKSIKAKLAVETKVKNSFQGKATFNTYLFRSIIISAKNTKLSLHFVCVGKFQCGNVNVVPSYGFRSL